MDKKMLMLACFFVSVLQALAGFEVSTTLPGSGKPEHLYTMVNGSGFYANGATGLTKTESKYGQFAFYAAGTAGQYYIYSYTAKKWVTYTQKSEAYSNQRNFVVMSDTKSETSKFIINEYTTDLYELQPLKSDGTGDKYLNWYRGVGAVADNKNPLDDASVTLGTWEQGGSADAGSRWTFSEVLEPAQGATPSLPANLKDIQAKYGTQTYDIAVLYPKQQDAVGVAQVAQENDGNVITLYNNVLAATFVKDRNYLWFGGSKAMNLEAGTEPFTIAFGTGYTVPASAMTLKNVEVTDVVGNANAVGGAEHYNGKVIVANYEYTFKDKKLEVVWKAVLRDGSHYLRTEMELTGDNVDMYNVVPLIYNVDSKAAGSKPAVVGNTRGAVLMSDKIFAGVEHPTAYNTVGDETGDEDKYDLTTTYDDVALTASSWKDMDDTLVPARIKETTGQEPSAIREYTKGGYALKEGQKVQVTLAYTSGTHRLNIGGVDMYSSTASNIDANDYHFGYTGSNSDKNVYSFVAPANGTYTIRLMVDGVSETITASSKLSVKVFTPKEGAVITSDIVPIKGRWSRNTTLAAGENWKISAVVGLVAADQARRSFLAYSERERAVPWRANPAYISWYELNINRNNAAPGSEPNNMTAAQVLNVEKQWYDKLYTQFGVAPNSFVIDDGWDTYGEWNFHSGFPNEMRDISASAAKMNAGVGAWLGPVGGYGQSGNYRRDYWKKENRGGMVLGNPKYYEVFKKAATNLVKNQGTKNDGTGSFQFFKFDGISGQFSATGPDAGDSGNENAEGIIRLERYVREELKRDIFFNTTVGTWASPFWFRYTDAVWRQENDYGTAGDNKIDRENWITYRDRLVYQNFVKNSPICPINTLMTHGFILSSYGAVSKDMSYEACRREMRCAFACGSGMVELYNDYALMNSIQHGQLWADLAECIKWQKANADVLPDAHWVGGNPWTGSKAEIYGWAAWNGEKATFTLRNGSNDSQSIKLTLREALEIPASVKASIVLRKSFLDQVALDGLKEGEAIDIDKELTLTLPGSSVYVFGGLKSDVAEVKVSDIKLVNNTFSVYSGQTCGVQTTIAPENVTNSLLEWTSSDESVATVYNGLVLAHKVGECEITVKANDGSGVAKTIKVIVPEKPFEPYATNFDKTASAIRSDRKITTINFKAGSGENQTVAISNFMPYMDMTSTVLTCEPGAEINSSIVFSSTYMHGYVYIDTNKDQKFSYNEGKTDQQNTELYSFAYYKGVNSKGETAKNNFGGTVPNPAFTAPTTPGTYCIRFKLDWDDVDPGGRIAADGTCTGENGILKNGGGIIDMTLKVGSETNKFHITDAGYATFYTSDAYTMPNGVTGYIITDTQDNRLIAQSAYPEGTLVPAMTALVVKGNEGDYPYEPVISSQAAIKGNLLHGTDTEQTTHVAGTDVKYYKLSYNQAGDKLGFYWGNDAGAAFTNGAHKAFLALDSNAAQSQKRGFSLDELMGVVTSVNNVVKANAGSQRIYDLNGRRFNSLNGLSKGVYIVNGKKVIIK